VRIACIAGPYKVCSTIIYYTWAVLFIIAVYAIVFYNAYADAHYRTVEDLNALITTNINTPIDSAASAAISISAQAAAAWEAIGSPMGTALASSVILPTLKHLLDEYHYYAVESVQIGTNAGDMVMFRRSSGTAGGLCVLQRTNSTACVTATAYNSGSCADDVYSAMEVCHYDPRQTEWFRAGRDASGQWYVGANFVPLSSSYTMPDGLVGLSAAVPVYNSSTLSGVWGADFSLGGLIQTLQLIQGGLSSSTLFMTDKSGIVLASSSGTATDAPVSAISSTDDNVQEAAELIVEKFDDFDSTEDGTYLSYTTSTILAISQTQALGVTLGMLNIVSTERQFLYGGYEKAVDFLADAVIVGAVILYVVAVNAYDRPWRLLHHEKGTTPEDNVDGLADEPETAEELHANVVQTVARLLDALE
jgi:hypothetical protein